MHYIRDSLQIIIHNLTVLITTMSRESLGLLSACFTQRAIPGYNKSSLTYVWCWYNYHFPLGLLVAVNPTHLKWYHSTEHCERYATKWTILYVTSASSPPYCHIQSSYHMIPTYWKDCLVYHNYAARILELLHYFQWTKP